MEHFHPLNGIAHPRSRAGEIYRGRLDEARSHAAATATLALKYYGGKTIPALTFVNLYTGSDAAWQASDRTNLDHALGAAMSDVGLNNVLAQYFNGAPPTTSMIPSIMLSDTLPTTVGKDTVEGWVTALHGAGTLPESDLSMTVYCFMLPQGVVLTDGPAAGGQSDAHDALGPDHDAADSRNGLGGYHGSVHVGGDTVYYAIGVYSDATNGIDAFPGTSWKNIVATFYHELNEARTDADVEDAAAASSLAAGEYLLGWYSIKGGEIGDIPITEAGSDLSTIMVEVPLTDGGGTVPVQLLWSDATGGPEGPVAAPTAATNA